MNQSLRLTVTLRPDAVVEGRSGLDRYFLSIASLGRKSSTLGVFEAELSVPLEGVLETVDRYRPAEAPASRAPEAQAGEAQAAEAQPAEAQP
jgi:hypothetical protein